MDAEHATADEEPKQVEDWLYSLISDPSPGTLEILTQYARHEDPEIRSTAAFGLGEISDARAIDPLIRIVDDDDDEKVRDEALRALSSYHDPRIHDCFIREVARTKRSRPPRQVVALNLRHYATRRAAAALRELLKDPDEFVRSDASESLELVQAALQRNEGA